MARARNLKPDFFRDAKVAKCDVWVRLLFAGLWTLADREGRLKDDPDQIGLDLFPRDGFDIEAGLRQLADLGLVERYEAGGVRVVWVRNFARHQNPHVNEQASTLPAAPDAEPSPVMPSDPVQAPEEHGASTVQAPEEHGATPADSLVLIPDSLVRTARGGVAASAPAREDAAPDGAAHADDSPPPIRSVPKTRTAKSRIAADWEPGEGLRAWAAGTLHVPPDFVAAQAELFRDHWLAKGEAMADWDAAFRKWLRNAVEFAGRDAARGNGRARPGRAEASLAVVPEASPGHRAATTEIPEGWWPSEEELAAARRFGLTAAQVETLTGEFVAHAVATGKTSLNWATAWQTRLRLVAQQGVAS